MHLEPPINIDPIGAMMPGSKKGQKDRNFLEMSKQNKGASSLVEGAVKERRKHKSKERSQGRGRERDEEIGVSRAARLRSKPRNTNLLNNSRFDALSKHISSYHSIGEASDNSDTSDDEEKL